MGIYDDLVSASMWNNVGKPDPSITRSMADYPGEIAKANALQNAAAIQEEKYRAAGGPVKEGQSYVVGEKGPEVFVPEKSGTILPNRTANLSDAARLRRAAVEEPYQELPRDRDGRTIVTDRHGQLLLGPYNLEKLKHQHNLVTVSMATRRFFSFPLSYSTRWPRP